MISRSSLQVNVIVMRSKNVLIDISVELLFIGGDAKKATEEYNVQIQLRVFSKGMHF